MSLTRPTAAAKPNNDAESGSKLLLDQILLEQCVWTQTRLRHIRAICVNHLILPAKMVADQQQQQSANHDEQLYSLICCIRLSEEAPPIFVSKRVPLSCSPEWIDIDLTGIIEGSTPSSNDSFTESTPFIIDIVLCRSSELHAKKSSVEFTRLISWPVSPFSSSSADSMGLTRLGRRYDDLISYHTLLVDLLPPSTLLIEFEEGLYAVTNRLALLREHFLERSASLSRTTALRIAERRLEEKHLHQSSNKIMFSTFGNVRGSTSHGDEEAFLENDDDDDKNSTAAARLTDQVRFYRHELIQSVLTINQQSIPHGESSTPFSGAITTDSITSFCSVYRTRSGYSRAALTRLGLLVKLQYNLEHSISQLHARLDATVQLSEQRRVLLDKTEKSRHSCAILTRNVDFLAVRFGQLQQQSAYLRELNSTTLRDLHKNHRIVQHNRIQIEKELKIVRTNLSSDFDAVGMQLSRREQNMVHDLMQLFDIKRRIEPSKSHAALATSLWSISGLILPDVRLWAANLATGAVDADEEKSRIVALGYTLHVLDILCRKIFTKPLPFPLRFGNTTASFLYDYVTPLATLKAHHASFAGNANEFSLSYFYRTSPTKDRQRFFYAILLLNLNIIQLRYEFGLQSTTCTDALENLCSFMLVRFDMPYRTAGAAAAGGGGGGLSRNTAVKKRVETFASSTKLDGSTTPTSNGSALAEEKNGEEKKIETILFDGGELNNGHHFSTSENSHATTVVDSATLAAGSKATLP